jgi:hypothetical protein
LPIGLFNNSLVLRTSGKSDAGGHYNAWQMLVARSENKECSVSLAKAKTLNFVLHGMCWRIPFVKMEGGFSLAARFKRDLIRYNSTLKQKKIGTSHNIQAKIQAWRAVPSLVVTCTMSAPCPFFARPG